MSQISYDLLRSGDSELIMVNQFKCAEFIRENPSFKIVGVGLGPDVVNTPYGPVGVVVD